MKSGLTPLKTREFHGVLGVVDVDIFVPELNYVFGEAYTPGRLL